MSQITFFRDVFYMTPQQEKVTSQTRDRVIEGVTWAKEFSKFHQNIRTDILISF